jgi:hypothetical protein
MSVLVPRRRAHWQHVGEDTRTFQFGQSDNQSTQGGSTGCTHACSRLIIGGATGDFPSDDKLSHFMGYPTAVQRAEDKGPSVAQVLSGLRAYGLHYEFQPFMSTGEVAWRAKHWGPVIIGYWYPYHPEWKGFHYGGLLADGQPNGFATPLRHAGKTQLNGAFTHASVLLSTYWSPTTGSRFYVHDPNHMSTARPEHPAFDTMTRRQFDRMYQSGRLKFEDNGKRYTVAYAPTREVPING